MRDRDVRALMLAALRPKPDFSGLWVLRRLRASRLQRLLRWLDQSGLAVYLSAGLHEHGALDEVPAVFRDALGYRLQANHARTLAMLEEFAGLVDSFHRHGVRFCALKGFTLTPDFCPAAHLRHQTDLDFLVTSDSLESAERALRSRGYGPGEMREPGEVTFSTPLQHVPTLNDDIYAIARHREVDLLTRLHHTAHGVTVDASALSLDDVEIKTLHGISFPALAAGDMFCLQVIHAFKHLLGSWVRASWLLEIDHFLGLHYDDENLWTAIVDRISGNAKTRNAFGLILALSKTLFPRSMPEPLAKWCLQSLPPRIEAWVARFGVQTAVAGLDGDKSTLFVHREFVDDRKSWPSYVWGRILPIRGNSSIGSVAASDPGSKIKSKMSQWRHTAHRSMFHARSIFSLPLDAIRWQVALRSIDRQPVQVSPALTR